jgi:hypothetical protein
MRSSFLGLGILGIVLLLMGAVFALQGYGIIGGSSMTGSPFWLYTGSVIAVIGIVLAVLGFVFGSRVKPAAPVATEQPK